MNVQEMGIQFHYVIPRFYFPHRNALKRFITKQLRSEGKEVEALNYIFCNDEYLLTINKQYLNHDTLTDIITFELSPEGQPLVADIYISVERVRENAKAFNTSFGNELLRVVFHGALHLAGYKDKKAEQAELMRSKEEEYLQAFRVSRVAVSK